MPKHPDFMKIHKRFISQYGKDKGEKFYQAWINKKGYDDTKALPSSKVERKEFLCPVIGVEIKETSEEYHVSGLIATTHLDDLRYEEHGIPDKISRDTLDSWAVQVNELSRARVMGVHHSEGKPINPEYYGTADVENTPAKVIQLNDGEHGLFVDTKLLKNDPKTPEIISRFESGDLNAFSVTYDTNKFMTTDFDWEGDELVRVLNPDTQLFGYTAASNPVNPNAKTTGFGFKEFKELIKKTVMEGIDMNKELKDEKNLEKKEEILEKKDEKPEDSQPSEDEPVKSESEESEAEKKEFLEYKKNKKVLEEKEQLDNISNTIAKSVMNKMETKEKVIVEDNKLSGKESSFEVKEFMEVISNSKNIELKEQAKRAASVLDSLNLKWNEMTTEKVELREFKHFSTNGSDLEFKSLGLTTNQNADTDYLQSTAELQDVYDPIIYNALNQKTLTWGILAKDDFSKKGNNQVQFVLKTAANASAVYYTGNAVSTDNVTRLKYQTKFKKIQVGVSVDGDMIAASRGGPVNDVFAQEVVDSTNDMMAVVNASLFAEVGLETASAVIGFEYITDSAGNTTLYNLTRSAANKLAPDSAADTYINGSSLEVSMANLRAAITQAMNEGADKNRLFFVTNPVQGNMLRGKMDDLRRLNSSTATDFGFSTDLEVDGVPIFEDKDCNTDDWFLIDSETHRVGIWIPPTIERLGKSSDSESAFIKMYFAVYNRGPRRMVQIYGNATS